MDTLGRDQSGAARRSTSINRGALELTPPRNGRHAPTKGDPSRKVDQGDLSTEINQGRPVGTGHPRDTDRHGPPRKLGERSGPGRDPGNHPDDTHQTQPQVRGSGGEARHAGRGGCTPTEHDETRTAHALREHGPPTSGVARAGIEPATFRFSGGRSYQLSYLAAGTRSECHTRNAGNLRRFFATLTGLEPATSAVTGRRANQLRHRAMLCYQRSEDRTPYGIRTRATALKGRRPRPLDEGGSSRISPDRLSTAVRWELG